MGKGILQEPLGLIKIKTDLTEYSNEGNIVKIPKLRRTRMRSHSDWGKTTQIKYFYRSQIAKFEKLGIGGVTEFGVEVTEQLMAITRKRLSELIC